MWFGGKRLGYQHSTDLFGKSGRFCIQLCHGLAVEAVADLGFVGFDSSAFDAEAVGDLSLGEALADELKNLELAVGEAGEFGVGGVVVLGVNSLACELEGDLGGEVDVIREDLIDGCNEFFGGLGFGDEAFGPGFKDSLGVGRGFHHGEDEHFDLRVVGSEFFEEFEAIFVFQEDVEEDEVGLVM